MSRSWTHVPRSAWCASTRTSTWPGGDSASIDQPCSSRPTSTPRNSSFDATNWSNTSRVTAHACRRPSTADAQPDRTSRAERARPAVEPRVHRRRPEAVDRDDVRDDVLDGPTLAAGGRLPLGVGQAGEQPLHPAALPVDRLELIAGGPVEREDRRSLVTRPRASPVDRIGLSQPIQNSLPSGSVMATHRVPFPSATAARRRGRRAWHRGRRAARPRLPESRRQVDVHAVDDFVGNPEEEHVPQPASRGACSRESSRSSAIGYADDHGPEPRQRPRIGAIEGHVEDERPPRVAPAAHRAGRVTGPSRPKENRTCRASATAASSSSRAPHAASAGSTRWRSPRKARVVVVNDLGVARDGTGADDGPAQQRGRRDRGARRRGGRQHRRHRRLGRRPPAGAHRDRHVRRPRRAREQRRLPARPHGVHHRRRRVGRGDPRAPQRPLRDDPPRDRVVARAGEGGRPTSTLGS